MINHLVKRPIGVLGILFMLVVPGWWLATTLPVQLMPEAEIPVLIVEIPIPGLPASEIEQRMMPSFRKAVARLEKLTDVRTFSLDEKAILHCEFSWDCSMHEQYDLLLEAMIMSTATFTQVQPPLVSLPGKTALPIATLMISSESMPLSELTVWARTKGIPYIEQVPSIAFCEMIGGSDLVPVFSPDFSMLNQHDLSLSDIRNALLDQTSGAFSILSSSSGQRIQLNIEQPRISIDSLEDILVQIKHLRIRLGQLGSIRLKETLGDQAASHNGQVAIALQAYQRPGTNLMELPAQLEEAIQSLAIHYPLIQVEITNDQASWISISIDGLSSGLIAASVLAICLLFLVIRTWQAPLLMGITIPISMGLTALVLSILDVGLNMMTLAGLTLGTGVLIDNGIVIVEQLEALRNQGSGPILAAIQASRKMAIPLLSSTITSVSIFIPIWLIEGRAAVLFQDLGLAVAISLGASLLIAVWILPVLSSLLPHSNRQSTSVRTNSSTGGYWVKMRILVVTGLTGIVVGCCFLPIELFPPVSQKSVLIHLNWNRDISLMENDQLCRRLQNEVFGEWESHGLSGNLSTSEGPLMRRESVLNVSIPTPDRDRMANALRNWLDQEVPECQVTWGEPDHALVEWIGKKSQRSYCLTPPDGDIRHIPSLVQETQKYRIPLDIRHSFNPQTLLSPDQEALHHHRIPSSDLAKEVRLYAGQNEFLTIHSHGKKKLLMKQKADQKAQPSGEFFVRHIPIGDLLQIESTMLPELVRGDLKGPFIQMTTHDPSIGEGAWMAKFKRFLEELGWGIQPSQRDAQSKSATRELLLMFGIGLLLLFVTLVAQFESFRFPLMILSTIPFGISGSLLLLFLTGQSLNMISGIGLIIVSGIVVNDAILKASTIRREFQLGATIEQAVALASQQRKRAILLTSATTILAMVPILFSSGVGAELQTPMAISVIGGISLGTVAAMWWIPALLLRFPPKTDQ